MLSHPSNNFRRGTFVVLGLFVRPACVGGAGGEGVEGQTAFVDFGGARGGEDRGREETACCCFGDCDGLVAFVKEGCYFV